MLAQAAKKVTCFNLEKDILHTLVKFKSDKSHENTRMKCWIK
jgi:hypothetical protein